MTESAGNIKQQISKGFKYVPDSEKEEKDHYQHKGIDHKRKEDLERQDNYEANKKLKEKFHKHVIVPLMLFFTIILVSLVFSVVYHLIMPEKWYWLEEKSVEEIEALLKAGTLGALLSSFAKKYIIDTMGK